MTDQRTTELRLDTDACMGHGRCYAVAPQLFDADDDGHALLLSTTVVAEQATQARLAERSCPERAISILEPPAS